MVLKISRFIFFPLTKAHLIIVLMLMFLLLCFFGFFFPSLSLTLGIRMRRMRPRLRIVSLDLYSGVVVVSRIKLLVFSLLLHFLMQKGFESCVYCVVLFHTTYHFYLGGDKTPGTLSAKYWAKKFGLNCSILFLCHPRAYITYLWRKKRAVLILVEGVFSCMALKLRLRSGLSFAPGVNMEVWGR